ncbi:ABC transporter permease, partial [Clostridium perfringens]|nr:ABC transporter permease [Clostridium perfringens]
TLGMENGSLSKMIFLETLFIGAISLGIGVVLGIMLSQALSVLTAYMFQVDLTKFQFVFSPLGFKRTVLCFSIIYLVVLIFNFISVRKIKLIDLLTASKRNEKPTIKNLWVSVILFLVSVVILGTAYYKVIHDGIAVASFNVLGLPIVLGCVGTFIFFYSLTGFFLKVIQENKKFYLRDLNMFVMKQISSKINTTFVSLSFICLMLFLAICIFSVGLGINRAINANLKDLAQFDVTFEINKNLDDNMLNSNINIEDLVAKNDINIESIAKYKSNIIMYDSGIKYSNFLSEEGMAKMSNYYSIKHDENIVLIGEKDFNATLSILGKKPIVLNENQYLATGNVTDIQKFINDTLKNQKAINIFGKKLYPMNNKCIDITLYNSLTKNDLLILVVDDSILSKLTPIDSKLNIMFNNNPNLNKNFKNIESKFNNLKVIAFTKQEIYDDSIGIGAIFSYLGIYIGLIFIITSAVILSIQQLTEVTDSLERYKLLKKIGVSEKMINRSIFVQIGVYFFIPLSLSIIHSIIGLKVSSNIINFLGNTNTMSNIILTTLIFIIIYGGYFLATYSIAKKYITNHS